MLGESPLLKDYSCNIDTSPELADKATSCCDINTAVEQHVNIGVGTDDNLGEDEMPVNDSNDKEVSLIHSERDARRDIVHNETAPCRDPSDINVDDTQVTVSDSETFKSEDDRACAQDPAQFADEAEHQIL